MLALCLRFLLFRPRHVRRAAMRWFDACCLSRLFLALLVTAAYQASGSVLGEDPRPTKHPVLKHRLDPADAANYEKAVSRVMAFSEADLLKLIPTQSPVLFCACPNCLGGQQEMRGFSWSIERPYELRCALCGHVYPSEKYRPNR